ncbi:MAG TPA: BamA/TamA family outer membrane protein [Gemmatimonadaceae bacterium]|nr:BamA/TamA family outer membrane protein [Gemmatimonadaceae bacterium]
MRRARRRLGPAAIAAFLLLAAGGTLRAQSDKNEHESPEVTELSLKGVRHVSKSQLEQSIATRATSCKSFLLEPFCLFSRSELFQDKKFLDRTELKRDVLRIKVFYWKRGYRSTQVDTSVVRRGEDKGVKVEFTIHEGPPTVVRTLAIRRPEKVITAKDVQRSLLLRASEPLNVIDLDSSMNLLRDRLWDEGYADAVLYDTVLVTADGHSAVVRVTIDPRARTVVDTLAVHGNQEITAETIRNMITLEEGQVYRRRDVLESQRNLYSSNLFSRAAITSKVVGDSGRRVDIDVTEAPFHRMRVSGGFNTVDFIQLEANFDDYSWLGGGRQLSVNGVLSNIFAPQFNGTGIFQNVTGNLTGDDAAPYLRLNYEAGVDITQPWWHDARNTLGLNLFLHRRSAPGIFIDKGYGAGATFTRMVASRSPLTIGYRYELTQVNAGNIYFCVNYGVCQPATIGALRGRHVMSPIALQIFTDRTDDPFSPTQGYTARLQIEHASAFTLSDFRYNRIAGDATRYISVGDNGAVLAGRIRLGWVRPLSSSANALGQQGIGNGDILHPRKRFYAGGSQSVRGYGENQLGPRVLTVDPDTLLAYGCTNSTIADGSCNPENVPSSDFEPRPTGGTSLIEANIEYRFPIWKRLGGAVFVDGAYVGEGSASEIFKGTGAITPGFGLRYQSPVGPIRIDLGIRPSLKEVLPVITQTIDSTGAPHLARLQNTKVYDPLEGSGGTFKKILRRLSLHLSIGQAF